jgi:hypothetical protein
VVVGLMGLASEKMRHARDRSVGEIRARKHDRRRWDMTSAPDSLTWLRRPAGVVGDGALVAIRACGWFWYIGASGIRIGLAKEVCDAVSMLARREQVAILLGC